MQLISPLLRLFYRVLLLGALMVALPAMAENVKVEQGRFLIATDAFNNTGFEQAVIYVIESNETGAYGLMVNRPTGIPLSEVMPDNPHGKDQIFLGGPLHGQYIFSLAETNQRDDVHSVKDDIVMGAGMEVLDRLTHDKGHPRVRAYVGFATWPAGQLEGEIDSGAWIVAPANAGEIFHDEPLNLWRALYERWSGDWT